MRSTSIAAIVAVGAVVYSSQLRLADDDFAAKLEESRTTILAAAARIDQLIDADRKKHSVEPSLPANDQIFMRRVYLNVTGAIPIRNCSHDPIAG